MNFLKDSFKSFRETRKQSLLAASPSEVQTAWCGARAQHEGEPHHLPHTPRRDVGRDPGGPPDAPASLVEQGSQNKRIQLGRCS